MTTHRARISDSRANDLLDRIGGQVAIMRHVQAIIKDLDPDTFGFHRRRLFAIVDVADGERRTLIAQMEAEKEAARNGRETE